MADETNAHIVFSGSRRHVVRITNASDGTGQTDAVVIDKSTLKNSNGLEPETLVIEELEWSIQGFGSVTLAFDHTDNDVADVLTGNGYRDYRPAGGLRDPASDGGTGDLLVTTNEPAAGASYDILIHCRIGK